ncbi:BppU family phage baseplate upper protein [Bacillus sp. AR18-7]|uniref:BppU family phage baseplate upper protein n=1 Tax=Bacillus sp. AR18-7 TaxID=2217821 RepID=UPI0011C7971B|nr:BppU family phage baseplate upper protein [Bacillus sp. AR18-7]TXR66953.1 DUF2479 domain-containing protein [Bacillus sp. AR18-7]
MNNQTYEITIDTKKSHCHSNIEFSQNNLNISELIFNITEDEKEFPLKDTDKIILYFRKPDKTVVFQDKEVVLLDKAKGKIKVLLTTQTLAKSGDVQGEISIERVENGTKKRVSTYGFTFKVRSSIASNDSIESTNEFQVFDKIIKVGEKFEGVDIDGIIGAGELAKGALPKTGGTMTGNLKVPRMETTDMTPLIFNGNNSNRSWKWDMVGDNLSITPTNVGAPGWDSSKAITFQTLVKNSEIYKGWIQPNGRTIILREGDDLNNVQESGIYGGPKLVNAPTQDYLYIEVIKYHDANYVMQRATTLTGSTMGSWVRRKTGATWNSWERLIDSKGGKLTGDLYLDRVGNATKKYAFMKDGVETFNFYNFSDTHVGLRDVKNNRNVWEYNATDISFNLLAGVSTNLVKKSDIYSNFTQPDGKTKAISTADLNTIFESGQYTGQNLVNAPEDSKRFFYVEVIRYAGSDAFRLQRATTLDDKVQRCWIRTMNNNVWQSWTEVTSNGKDGRANLTLTGNASNIDPANVGPIADRRGNTVTLRMAIRRTTAVQGDVLITLPVDIRPTLTLHQGVISTDGLPARLQISTSGDIIIAESGTPVQNKNFYITITYVVN